MTPEDQARLLAEWLERHPGEDPPADLDPEVVEAVYALRADLAPPPRVTADDILAEVIAGPLVPGWSADLASDPEAGEEEPTSAEVVPFPSEVDREAMAAGPARPQPVATPAARPRRWGRWVAGTTVGTALAMAAAALLFVRTLSFQADEAAPTASADAPRQEVAFIPEATAPGPKRGALEAEEPAVALLDTDAPAERLAARSRPAPHATSGPPTVIGGIGYFDETTAQPDTPTARPKVAAARPPVDYDAVADGFEDLELDGDLSQETAGTSMRSGGGTGWGGKGSEVGLSTTTASTSSEADLRKKDMQDIPDDDRVAAAVTRGQAPVAGTDNAQREVVVVAADRTRGDEVPAATAPPAPAPADPSSYQDYGTVADVGEYEEDEEAQPVSVASDEVVFMQRRRPRISLGGSGKGESSRRNGRASKSEDASREAEIPEVTVPSEPIAEVEPSPEPEPDPAFARDKPVEQAKSKEIEHAPASPEPADESAPEDAHLDSLRARAIPPELSEEALMVWAPAANAGASELATEEEYFQGADALEGALGTPAPEGQIYAAQAANHRLLAGEVEQANEVALHGLAISDANTPERAWLLVLYGDALRATGEHDRAARAYEQAIALNLGRANR
ncbi:MAG: hypothetical protein JRJ84_06265 [Deltaproteobacteria bacterium]|nr:hypothetical protein [Deltaproteobacteria bacterium]